MWHIKVFSGERGGGRGLPSHLGNVAVLI